MYSTSIYRSLSYPFRSLLFWYYETLCKYNLYAKTNEQASGFGAISIIILAAIGGIWVPSFVMPSYMQMIGKISPLHWCLEGYYTLFLKGGDLYLLTPTILFLILFILACQILIYTKLKIQNYI